MPTIALDSCRMELEPFSRHELDRHQGTVFGLHPDLTLGYVNPAWGEFAGENGGAPSIARDFPLGCSVLEGFHGPVADFYARVFAVCLDRQTSWEHLYECSSPERFRRFHLTVYPLANRQGLLLVHSLATDQPHDPARLEPIPAEESRYHDHQGLLHQCGHCRRMKRAEAPEQWDWIRDWVVASPRNTSHTLCPVCLDFYYAEQLRLQSPDPSS